MSLTATLLQQNWGGYAGDHRLYQLSQPLADVGRGTSHPYVVVFATSTFGTPETVIVPAREDGSAIVMNRLPGSLVGIADHAGALWAAGGFVHGEPYSVVVPEPAGPEPIDVDEVPPGDPDRKIEPTPEAES